MQHLTITTHPLYLDMDIYKQTNDKAAWVSLLTSLFILENALTVGILYPPASYWGISITLSDEGQASSPRQERLPTLWFKIFECLHWIIVIILVSGSVSLFVDADPIHIYRFIWSLFRLSSSFSSIPSTYHVYLLMPTDPAGLVGFNVVHLGLVLLFVFIAFARSTSRSHSHQAYFPSYFPSPLIYSSPFRV